MGLLTHAVLLEARIRPSDEAFCQDHRGCCKILPAFGVVKGAVYAQISQVFFILFFWMQICGRLLGLLKHGIRLLLGREHLFPIQERKCSFSRGPDIKP